MEGKKRKSMEMGKEIGEGKGKVEKEWIDERKENRVKRGNKNGKGRGKEEGEGKR